jgi:hypothetical protein
MVKLWPTFITCVAFEWHLEFDPKAAVLMAELHLNELLLVHDQNYWVEMSMHGFINMYEWNV